MSKKIPFPIATIIIAGLAALVIGAAVYCQKQGWGLPTIFFPKKEITFSDDCNELIRQINDLVEKANYCNADSDCSISTEVTKFCGCWSLINKNADLAKIKEGNEKYTKLNCPVVMCGECMAIPQQEDIKCINHRCVDMRFAKPEKELACINSGGKIFVDTCYCEGVKDFPSNCEIGICTCNPAGGYANQIKMCDCGERKCFDGESCANFPF